MSPRQQRRLDIDDRHWQLLKILAASLNTSPTHIVEWALNLYALEYRDHVVSLFEDVTDEAQDREGQ